MKTIYGSKFVANNPIFFYAFLVVSFFFHNKNLLVVEANINTNTSNMGLIRIGFSSLDHEVGRWELQPLGSHMILASMYLLVVSSIVVIVLKLKIKID